MIFHKLRSSAHPDMPGPAAAFRSDITRRSMDVFRWVRSAPVDEGSAARFCPFEPKTAQNSVIRFVQALKLPPGGKKSSLHFTGRDVY